MCIMAQRGLMMMMILNFLCFELFLVSLRDGNSRVQLYEIAWAIDLRGEVLTCLFAHVDY